MRPIRLRPHALYLPHRGAKRVRYADVAGWALRPLPQYRDDGQWPPPTPEVPVTPEALIAWRARHPDATCNNRIARVLCALERDWGRVA